MEVSVFLLCGLTSEYWTACPKFDTYGMVLLNSSPIPLGRRGEISSFKWFLPAFPTVLRILDILVWIRILIRGSMPLTNGSGSLYFHHWPSRCKQKTNLKKKFFCTLLFEDTFTSFFKGNKSKRGRKTVEIRFFLLFLLYDRMIRIRIHTSD